MGRCADLDRGRPALKGRHQTSGSQCSSRHRMAGVERPLPTNWQSRVLRCQRKGKRIRRRWRRHEQGWLQRRLCRWYRILFRWSGYGHDDEWWWQRRYEGRQGWRKGWLQEWWTQIIRQSILLESDAPHVCTGHAQLQYAQRW